MTEIPAIRLFGRTIAFQAPLVNQPAYDAISLLCGLTYGGANFRRVEKYRSKPSPAPFVASRIQDRPMPRASQSDKLFLNMLPVELRSEIAKTLDAASIVNFSATCRVMHKQFEPSLSKAKDLAGRADDLQAGMTAVANALFQESRRQLSGLHAAVLTHAAPQGFETEIRQEIATLPDSVKTHPEVALYTRLSHQPSAIEQYFPPIAHALENMQPIPRASLYMKILASDVSAVMPKRYYALRNIVAQDALRENVLPADLRGKLQNALFKHAYTLDLLYHDLTLILNAKSVFAVEDKIINSQAKKEPWPDIKCFAPYLNSVLNDKNLKGRNEYHVAALVRAWLGRGHHKEFKNDGPNCSNPLFRSKSYRLKLLAHATRHRSREIVFQVIKEFDTEHKHTVGLEKRTVFWHYLSEFMTKSVVKAAWPRDIPIADSVESRYSR